MENTMDTEEYKLEKTIFEFDADAYWVNIWIDGYYMKDGQPVEDPWEQLEERFGENVAKNALHCGFNYEAKDGSDFSIIGPHDFILAKSVEGLKNRFAALRDEQIEEFAPYPQNGIGQTGRPFMQLSAVRSGEGVRIHLSTDAWSHPSEFDIALTAKELDELCAYFKRINEWFPTVGSGNKQVLRRETNGENHEQEVSDG